MKNFHVEKKQQKKFREWLLYDTTLDPFLLSADLSKETIQEIEDYFEKLKEELIRQEKESGSSL